MYYPSIALETNFMKTSLQLEQREEEREGHPIVTLYYHQRIHLEHHSLIYLSTKKKKKIHSPILKNNGGKTKIKSKSNIFPLNHIHVRYTSFTPN